MRTVTRNVTLNARGAERLRSGHPWVEPASIERDDGEGSTASSDVARVVDGRGKLLGMALVCRGARVALRVYARDEVAFDEALLTTRIRAALGDRMSLLPTCDAFRVVHGEADLLPGLFIDRYNDVAVIQTATAAMDAREPVIAAIVEQLFRAHGFGTRLVVARDDGSARDVEGLPRRRGVLCGEGATPDDHRVTYHDAGSACETDVLSDGKTGGYLDQQENHARAFEYGRLIALANPAATALDAFTFHGGFALALARAGLAVTALDESAPAIDRTRANARRNGLAVDARCDNAFDALRRYESDGRHFDVVVIDPPALAKRGSGPHGLAAAERAYKELNLRALRLLAPRGLLFSCSCSGKLTVERFARVIEAAARDVGRPVQIVERRGAARDHAPLLQIPETDYLKCWIMRVLE